MMLSSQVSWAARTVCAAAVVCAVVSVPAHGDLIPGQSIGIDLGTTYNTGGAGAEPNFNEFGGNVTNASAIDTTGASTGVTITITGVTGSMGESNLGFGAADIGDYSGTPFSDLTFNDGVYRSPGDIVMTLSGLHDSLTYDISAISGGPGNQSDRTVSAMVDGMTLGQTYDQFRADDKLHPLSFTDVSTDGSGNIEMTFSNPGVHFGLSALYVTAVPEPSPLILGALALIGLAMRRRRR